MTQMTCSLAFQACQDNRMHLILLDPVQVDFIQEVALVGRLVAVASVEEASEVEASSHENEV